MVVETSWVGSADRSLLALCKCSTCGLCNQNDFKPVMGYGNSGARVIFVGEAAGRNEHIQGIPFVGESGRLLTAVLQRVQLSDGSYLQRDDVYLTNACLCRPEDNRTPSAAEIVACNERLKAEIKSLPNRHLIVVLGSSAIKAVTGKHQSMNAMHGKIEWSAEFQCFITYTWHPAYILRTPNDFPDLDYVMSQIPSILDTPKGPIQFQPPKYIVEDSIDMAIKRLLHLLDHVEGDVACDIETTNLELAQPTNFILEIGFSWEDGKAYILPHHIFNDSQVKVVLIRFLEKKSVRFVYHNGMFDIAWLRYKLGAKQAWIGADTMLMSSLYDPRGRGGGEGDEVQGVGTTHGLKPLSRKHCQAPAWEDDIHAYLPNKEASFELIPADVRQRYMSFDLVYTLRLFRRLTELLEKEDPSAEGYPTPLECHYNLLIPAANMLADIESHGILIDRKYVEELRDKMEEQMRVSNEKIREATKEFFRRDGQEITLRKSRDEEVTERKRKLVGTEVRWKARKRYDKSAKAWVPDTPVPDGVRQLYEYEYITRVVKRYYDVVLRGEEAVEHLANEFNVRSALHLRHILYDHLGLPPVEGKEVTDKDQLERYKHAHLIIPLIMEYKNVNRLYGIFIKGMLARLDPYDRCHPRFNIHATRTGRLSSSNPNSQNIPRDGLIKRMFTVPKGYVFVESDYSGLEFTVIAWYCNAHVNPAFHDPTLAQDVAGDIHQAFAEEAFAELLAKIRANKRSLSALEQIMREEVIMTEKRIEQERDKRTDPEEVASLMLKHARFMAKFCTFGILYGRSAHSLAFDDDGMHVSLEQAEEYLRKFFAKYNGLYRFLQQQTKYALERGWQEMPSGRRAKYPFITRDNRSQIERQSWNSPIQGGASDICLGACIDLQKELVARGWGYVLFIVHDAIMMQLKEEHMHEGIALMKSIMEGVTQKLKSPVDFRVETKVGKNWGDAVDIEVEHELVHHHTKTAHHEISSDCFQYVLYTYTDSETGLPKTKRVPLCSVPVEDRQATVLA